MACPRHILNNNVGISRDVFCQKLADGTDIKIEQISCRRSGDERDGLALIVRSLRLNGGTPSQQKKDYQGHSFHFDLRYETVSSCQKSFSDSCLSFRAQREILVSTEGRNLSKIPHIRSG